MTQQHHPACCHHAETQLLRIERSLGLLCSQYLASALRPNYPSFPIVSRQSSLAIKRQTLKTRFLPVKSPNLINDTIDPTDYDNVIKDFHHQTVQMAILNHPPNSILQDIPPEIDLVEKTFHKAHRTALSQLRSVYCKALNTFQNLLGPSIANTCPDCDGGEDHTTQHLFRCSAYPTDLCVGELWLRLDLVTHSLHFDPSFLSLPPSSSSPATRTSPYAGRPLKSHPGRDEGGPKSRTQVRSHSSSSSSAH